MPVKITEKEAARFLKGFDKRGPDDCWHWRGHRNQMSFAGRSRTIMQAAYIYFNRVYPLGRQVAHSCSSRDCVNPAHLFLK